MKKTKEKNPPEESTELEQTGKKGKKKRKDKKKKPLLLRLILGILRVFLILVLVLGAVCFVCRTAVSTQIAGLSVGFLQSSSDYVMRIQAIELAQTGETPLEEKEHPAYNALEGSTFPEKLDLRDIDGKNYVTSVKDQSPFGTCWAFGTVAAAEVSLLTQLDAPNIDGQDYIDLSERKIAWFSYMPLQDQEPSQTGEGQMAANEDYTGYTTDPKVVMNMGGTASFVASLLKSGVGFLPEEYAPYYPDEAAEFDADHLVEICEGKDLTDEAVLEKLRDDPVFAEAEPYLWVNTDGTLRSWNEEGTWSVDEKYRFTQAIPLKEFRTLPEPTYGNPEGVNAMKQELSEGRAIAISYCADTSSPSQEDAPDAKHYMHWNEDGVCAQYTYEDSTPNHAVCVIGWDDTISSSVFNEDPALCPPGDGAWIVKNSWGSVENGFPDHGSSKAGWGTNGTGYFYLSYYDCSITEPQTMIFDIESMATSEDDIVIANEYDFMVSSVPVSLPMLKLNISSANVFCAEIDQRLHSVGVDLASPETATVRVYRLKDDWKKPTDGELVDTVTFETEYAGFRRIALNNPLDLKQGEYFSIVLEERTEENSIMTIHLGFSMEGAKTLHNLYLEAGGDPEFDYMRSYSVGVVNPGESFFHIGDMWLDLYEVASTAGSCGNYLFKNFTAEDEYETICNIDWTQPLMVMDNFAIKGYASPLN